GKLFRACLDQICRLEQCQRALRSSFAGPTPIIKSLASTRNRLLHIGLATGRISADSNIMPRRHTGDLLAIGAGHPFAVDQHGEIPDFEPSQRLRFYDHAHHHSPLNAASRFSLKALTPSLRSPVFATRIEPSASTAVPLSSPLATAIINFEISSAAGPRLATRIA